MGDLANIVQSLEPVTLKQFYDFDYKESCRVATTANGTLASAFANGQTIDGVTLATGNRILIKNQTAAKNNGIYTVNATGAPTRAIDANISSKVTSGLFTTVSEGTANADKSFVLTTNDAIVLDTTAIAFAEITAGVSAALNLKANIASPTFTGTVGGITKAMVGLPNVDNTSDANKPVSTAQQTALNLKANLAGPTFTGVPAAPTISPGTSSTQLATTAFVMTSFVTVADGLVGTPSIAFSTDTDCGIYRAGVNLLGVAGALTVTGDITGLTSDKRLKKNIKILSNPLDKLKVLSGFTYDWSLDKCSEAGFEPKDEEQIGVFAQDVQSVIPQAVKPAPFDTDSEGNSISGDNYLTVQYEKIVPLLIECIKELKEEIDELKDKV